MDHLDWDDECSLLLATRLVFLFQRWLEKQWYEKRHSLNKKTIHQNTHDFFTPRKGLTPIRPFGRKINNARISDYEGDRSRALILHDQLTTFDPDLKLTEFELYIQEKLNYICVHQLKCEIFLGWSKYVGFSSSARDFYNKKRLRDGMTSFIGKSYYHSE